MLDTYLPHPRLVETSQIDLGAEPKRVYEAARHLDLGRSRIVRVLFGLRLVPDTLNGRISDGFGLALDDFAAPAPGLHFLADEPGRGFAIGAVGRFWKPHIEWADVTPDQFAAFHEPGWAKVAWSVRVTPRGAGSRLDFELRLDATDEAAWHRVRRFHRFMGPLSRFIRRRLLQLLERDLGTPEEAERKRTLPGDERIANPYGEATHGITIAATPSEIWPWLVQMGCGRAGWYSHDWLDNGGRPSAREIIARLQELREGDVIAATPDGVDGFEVLTLEPERALVLGGVWDEAVKLQRPFSQALPQRYWRITWSFVLEPLGARETRLIVRARADFSSPRELVGNLWKLWAHRLMQPAQLEALKDRAEHHPHHSARDVAEGVVGALGMALDLATPMLRQRRARWGLDANTAARDLPGDELVPEPRWSWSHAVEIEAPPEAVWPWVAQIGQDKAGFYSYQLLENLAGCNLQNASYVHPEWAQVKVGDELRLHPDAPPLTVAAYEDGRWFVAAGEDPDAPEGFSASWLFYLEPVAPGRTRLTSRFRAAYEGRSLKYGPYLVESIGFVMDRRMLLGVKERVEHAS